MKNSGPCQSKTQHAFLQENMESLCLKYSIYLYVPVSTICRHLRESLMIPYSSEPALSSKQPNTEIKGLLFSPVPQMSPHQHLWPNTAWSLVSNQTLLHTTGKESNEDTSKPEFRSHG